MPQCRVRVTATNFGSGGSPAHFNLQVVGETQPRHRDDPNGGESRRSVRPVSRISRLDRVPFCTDAANFRWIYDAQDDDVVETFQPVTHAQLGKCTRPDRRRHATSSVPATIRLPRESPLRRLRLLHLAGGLGRHRDDGKRAGALLHQQEPLVAASGHGQRRLLRSLRQLRRTSRTARSSARAWRRMAASGRRSVHVRSAVHRRRSSAAWRRRTTTSIRPKGSSACRSRARRRCSRRACSASQPSSAGAGDGPRRLRASC